MFRYQLISSLLALFCVSALAAVNQDCKVKIRGDFAQPTPVILKQDTAEIVIPDKTAAVLVNNGDSVELYCSDSFTAFNGKLVTAKCLGGTNFQVNGKSYSFSSLTCKSWPSYVAKQSQTSCSDTGTIIGVGFQVDEERFVESYRVCHDLKTETTLYSRYQLGAYSKYFQTNVDRPEFEQLQFYGTKNLQTLYSKTKQIETIGNILKTNANKYFVWDKYLYLSRGHLAAKADFVYGSQQMASFLYVNVAPQWQSINGGNWGEVEIIVRDLANSNKANFLAFSGTFGVSTLPNNKGVETPLYLTTDSKIAVPKAFYRIVVDQQYGKAVAIVTVNDPYKTLDQLYDGYIVCNDVSDQLSYLRSWAARTDLSLGYTYACSVPEFLAQVPSAPRLNVSGLLV